jgi:predicted methyltransferase
MAKKGGAQKPGNAKNEARTQEAANGGVVRELAVMQGQKLGPESRIPTKPFDRESHKSYHG